MHRWTFVEKNDESEGWAHTESQELLTLTVTTGATSWHFGLFPFSFFQVSEPRLAGGNLVSLWHSRGQQIENFGNRKPKRKRIFWSCFFGKKKRNIFSEDFPSISLLRWERGFGPPGSREKTWPWGTRLFTLSLPFLPEFPWNDFSCVGGTPCLSEPHRTFEAAQLHCLKAVFFGFLPKDALFMMIGGKEETLVSVLLKLAFQCPVLNVNFFPSKLWLSNHFEESFCSGFFLSDFCHFCRWRYAANLTIGLISAFFFFMYHVYTLIVNYGEPMMSGFAFFLLVLVAAASLDIAPVLYWKTLNMFQLSSLCDVFLTDWHVPHKHLWRRRWWRARALKT